MAKSKRGREKMEKEILIKVTTPLGIYVGLFLWPEKHFGLLEQVNKECDGYVFHIEGTCL